MNHLPEAWGRVEFILLIPLRLQLYYADRVTAVAQERRLRAL